MKSIKSKILFFSAILALTVSCKKADVQLPDAIPADASFVVGFESKQISGKGGINKPEDFKLFSLLRAETANLDEDSKKLFDQFIKEPKSTGLDLDRFYVYGKTNENGNLDIAFVFKMDDVGKFENTLKSVSKNADANFTPEDKGAYKIVIDESGYGMNVAIAWNKTYLFAFAAENLNDFDIAQQFSLPDGKKITDKHEFAEFRKQNYDIGLWISYSDLVKLNKELTSSMYGASGMFSDMMPEFDWDGAYLNTYLNFENGEIKMTGNISPKSKFDDFLNKYPLFKKEFDNNLLQDFPRQTFMSIKLAVNPLEYVNFMKEIFSKTTTDDDYNRYNPYDEILQMMNDKTFVTVINALDGDMLFNIYDFAKGPIPIPLVGCNFTVKSENDFEELVKLLPKDLNVQKKDKNYVIMSSGVAVYFAYKNNRVLVTNDSDAMTAFTGKGLDKNLAGSALTDVFKTGAGSFYINLDLDSYPETAKLAVQSFAGRDYKTFVSYMNIYKDFSITMKDNVWTMSLKMKNGNVNALKQILKNIDDNVSSMTGNF